MDYYKQNRDSYIEALQEFWKLRIQRRFENAAEKNTDVVEAVTALMKFAEIDDAQRSHVEKALMTASLGDMCDEEITKALNIVVGDEASFGNIKFDADDEIEVDEDSINVFMELYTQIITDKTEKDFEIFCTLPRFQRYHQLKEVGHEIIGFGKLSVAVAIGVVVANKINKDK